MTQEHGAIFDTTQCLSFHYDALERFYLTETF